MSQLTLRGFDKELHARIETLARERGISLNKAALLLLRRGAGLEAEGTPSNRIGDALEAFIGSWSRDEEMQLLASLEPLEQVDEQMWR